MGVLGYAPKVTTGEMHTSPGSFPLLGIFEPRPGVRVQSSLRRP